MLKKLLKDNRGMTYVELIVVLSIAGLLAGVSLFNYKGFQERVDMTNLANDIASKIVEAQKSSISGKLPVVSQPSNWKPSYGISFKTISASTNRNFYLFTDYMNLGVQDKKVSSSDINSCPSGECTQVITINNNYYIESIKSYTGTTGTILNTPLHISFTRPNSGAVFYNDTAQIIADYMEIKVSSLNNQVKVSIKVYPSGRVEII